jgi:hypothetical protein
MAKFIPVKYRGKAYPAGISCPIKEVAGHLDKTSIDASGAYSLHTEYSYGRRKLNSSIMHNHLVLKDANKEGIPQLWKNETWSIDFFAFIQALVGDGVPPEVIEIHPPFDDYCSSIDHFLDTHISVLVSDNERMGVYGGPRLSFSLSKEGDDRW